MANYTMHADFAVMLGFHFEVIGRGAGDGDRSTKLRAERGRLKSCKDDEKIAQAQRGTSAGLGKRHKMIPFLFSNLVWRARARQTRLEKRKIGYGWRFTQGGGLGGLALGYYLAAPPGAPEAT
ncbi:MAG TPA: hypothetical protein VFE51_25150 [Verrucomicrobiae bacterium]|nr:hypothetical protein [Verrucomicrobiae bacterium]